MTPCVALSTAPSQDEARQLAKGILEARLAACVNIVPGVESHYWWQGKLESAPEWLLLIKTSREKFDPLAAFVREHHSYECPEVVALAPTDVEANYLKWWHDETETAK